VVHLWTGTWDGMCVTSFQFPVLDHVSPASPCMHGEFTVTTVALVRTEASCMHDREERSLADAVGWNASLVYNCCYQ
jgi:hypothetical protein